MKMILFIYKECCSPQVMQLKSATQGTMPFLLLPTPKNFFVIFLPTIIALAQGCTVSYRPTLIITLKNRS